MGVKATERDEKSSPHFEIAEMRRRLTRRQHPDRQSNNRRKQKDRVEDEKPGATDILLDLDCGNIQKKEREQSGKRWLIDKRTQKDLPDLAVEEGRIRKKDEVRHQPFKQGGKQNTYRVRDCQNRRTVDRMTPKVRNRTIFVKAR